MIIKNIAFFGLFKRIKSSRVDFPEPDLPTNAVVCFGFIVKNIFFKVSIFSV